jgi:hypothetical protein
MPHDLDGFAYDPRNKDCSGAAELNLDLELFAWSSWVTGGDDRGHKGIVSDTCINVVIGHIGGQSQDKQKYKDSEFARITIDFLCKEDRDRFVARADEHKAYLKALSV